METKCSEKYNIYDSGCMIYDWPVCVAAVSVLYLDWMKKLPYLFAIFLFAFLFVLGLMLPEQHRYADTLRIAGQIGLGLSLLLFFIVQRKGKRR
jgi:hypothetical protein